MSPENRYTPKEFEQKDIVRFSPESRFALEQAGYSIFQLRGASIGELETSGQRFQIERRLRPDELSGLQTRFSEVAINPNLRLSHAFETLTSLRVKVELEGMKLRRRLGVQDVDSIIGNAADYSQIFSDYYQRTGDYLEVRSETFESTATRSGLFTRRIGKRIVTYPNFLGEYPSVAWRFGYDFRSLRGPRIYISPKFAHGAIPLIVPRDSLSEQEVKSRDRLYTAKSSSKITPPYAYFGENLMQGIMGWNDFSKDFMDEIREEAEKNDVFVGQRSEPEKPEIIH